jgi:enterochelin esterase family protein|tara:strand:+ start:180 stop:989 length:810 start_codon:yes stop_codon:yes gene_type:complete
MKYLFLALLITSGCATKNINPDSESGFLSENKIIKSTHLGYDVQYRVLIPKNYAALDDLPTIYITDGQDYITSGKMPRVINKLIEENRIRPTIGVFIDSRDTADLSKNRRNAQFACNYQYFEFVTHELVSKIDLDYRTSQNANDRAILGLSFGGLNSACFGLLGSDVFNGIAMQSPATFPVPDLIKYYQQSKKLPLKFYISSGSVKDFRMQTRVFYKAIKNMGYPVKYQKVPGSHNWDNWRPLLDDVMIYFFPWENVGQVSERKDLFGH